MMFFARRLPRLPSVFIVRADRIGSQRYTKRRSFSAASAHATSYQYMPANRLGRIKAGSAAHTAYMPRQPYRRLFVSLPGLLISFSSPGFPAHPVCFSFFFLLLHCLFPPSMPLPASAPPLPLLCHPSLSHCHDRRMPLSQAWQENTCPVHNGYALCPCPVTSL